jgi:photosystem II oxygen-evolving enhancer protein 1
MMFKAVTLACVMTAADAFVPVGKINKLEQALNMKKAEADLGAEFKKHQKALTTVLASGFIAASSFGAAPAGAITKDDINSLSYEQVKGSGLANRCPTVAGSDNILIKNGLKVTGFCMEPTKFRVEVESSKGGGEVKKEFVNTKLMTRQTYSLNDVSGQFKTGLDGKAEFVEEDGIDYSATTVQLPGSPVERVPFLFSIKDLVAKGSGSVLKPDFSMGGQVTVPSYRTGLFLDPKGRGTTTGYDMAVALPGLQSGTPENEAAKYLENENNKRFEVLKGNVEFKVTNVNAENGEFGGVFIQNQPGDTDMGGKKPKNIQLEGIFYGKVGDD